MELRCTLCRNPNKLSETMDIKLRTVAQKSCPGWATQLFGERPADQSRQKRIKGLQQLSASSSGLQAGTLSELGRQCHYSFRFVTISRTRTLWQPRVCLARKMQCAFEQRGDANFADDWHEHLFDALKRRGNQLSHFLRGRASFDCALKEGCDFIAFSGLHRFDAEFWRTLQRIVRASYQRFNQVLWVIGGTGVASRSRVILRPNSGHRRPGRHFADTPPRRRRYDGRCLNSSRIPFLRAIRPRPTPSPVFSS